MFVEKCVVEVMGGVQANRAEQDEVLILNVLCYDNRSGHCLSLKFYFLEGFFAQEKFGFLILAF